jgi:ribonuclease P protein component
MAKAQDGGARGPVARVTTLKRRHEFQRVREGARCAAAAFVLEGKARDGATPALPARGARFGFTVARPVGKAVERNRIRRRLKAAIAGLAADHARPDFDYVVIARRPALTAPFAQLVAELANAFDRLQRVAPQGRRHIESSRNRAR